MEGGGGDGDHWRVCFEREMALAYWIWGPVWAVFYYLHSCYVAILRTTFFAFISFPQHSELRVMHLSARGIALEGTHHFYYYFSFTAFFLSSLHVMFS